MDDSDLVIIGGGPAGMAAALVAGRARLRTLVLNTESPRNAVTKASHGFLTRDGAHPSELLAVAKEQLSKYTTVRYLAAAAETVEALDEGLVVVGKGGERWQTQRLLIATGHRDELARLNLPGIEEVYGRTAFPCPFCDGFEHADERLAVFVSDAAAHFVPVVSVWSRDIVVFSNGKAIDPDAKARLEAGGVRVEEGAVARLHSEDGRLQAVELQDGTRIDREAAFVAEDYSVPATDFAERLGVPLVENDWGMQVPQAEPNGRTPVDGVYVIGDSRTGFGGLMSAAHDGSICASTIVHEIAQQRWASP